ncbi:YegP family protein [Arthrobacter sp. ISL-30]|uniref:YegP family protein n=1 Tax=Arthrobacter sp. ISL-30 TaxID=2819109 RepID=UPI001BEAD82A|nr:YegP family protein [Arthrobacter sp. ISL-30]MBT2515796.1 hypothetical protein [Arthrobacter sp. ISL-30]
MSGHFEVVDAPDGGCRVRLLDDRGEVVAVSVRYPTVQAAAAGIYRTREIAASGLIRDCRARDGAGSGPGEETSS